MARSSVGVSQCRGQGCRSVAAALSAFNAAQLFSQAGVVANAPLVIPDTAVNSWATQGGHLAAHDSWAVNAHTNLFVGYDAGNQTATGNDNNTGIGNGCLNGLTTGEQNTAVGQHALLSITTGGFNVAVGNGAMGQCTTNSRCVAVGTGNLHSTSGNDNVALGYNCLNVLTTGGQNVVAGKSGGFLLTTGSGNVIIGDSTCAAGLVSGSNNVLIGNAADTIAAGTSNSIALGQSAVGSANDFSTAATINTWSGHQLDAAPAAVTAATFTFSLPTNTHGAFKGRVTISANDATALRECIRCESSGTAAMIGFLGAVAVAQQANASQAGITAVTDANAKAALQAIYNLLVAYGLAPATA